MEPGERFELQGDPGTMISDKMVFQIRRCNQAFLFGSGKLSGDCAPQNEVAEYLRDLTVETWSVTEKVDFSKY